MKLNKVILVGSILFMIFTVTYINNNKLDNTHENTNKSSIEVLFNNDKNNKMSEKEAIEKVKAHLLKTGTYLPSIIEVDSIDGNYYVVHAYEIVTNEEESHTATMGWFHVNMYTGEISDIMN